MKRMSFRRSTLKLSAMTTTRGWPFAAHTMASPMPVLPLVASTTVWPGFSSPVFSAASMMPSASRSLMDPSGLRASSFTQRFTCGGARWLSLTTGVRPTVSRMLAYRAMACLVSECSGTSPQHS